VRDRDCAVYPSSVQAKQQIYECNSGGQLSMAQKNPLGGRFDSGLVERSTIFVHEILLY
jgi:hypothetical protein